MAVNNYDFVVVGAGIVGLTVANELLNRTPDARIAILEKEAMPGIHASGRNSGVLHCGIYYGSDTFKARVCSEGAREMSEFAREEKIPLNRGGKVIVATSEDQLPTVDRLLKNAKDNNIQAERIDNQQLKELEPFAASGPAAIYCPTTAVIDSAAVVERLRIKLEQAGVEFFFNAKVTERLSANKIGTTVGPFSFGHLYNCAGAYADRVARLFGLGEEYALIPFKGIYWKLSQASEHKVRSNIYPVPDVSLPFLGVHLTRVINGDVYVGPTAIPAFGRENYGKIKGIRLNEFVGIGYRLGRMYVANKNSFRKMAHLEMAKYRKSHFLEAARKLLPTLVSQDMIPTSKAGIRPQLVNTKTGKLEMDYILETTEHSTHVLNAISPAFTSSFAFAKKIVK